MPQESSGFAEPPESGTTFSARDVTSGVVRRRKADRQVLFRLDDDLLAKLDVRLRGSPYKTRNAWFKAMVEDFLNGAKR